MHRGRSLSNDTFIEEIIARITSSNIDTNKICFEITETAAIANLTHATNFIARVKQLGCKFALDDFGSGLSSFGYLKNFPIDFLKIDGMFVKDLCDDPIDFAMVKSIHEIGKVMGKKTIAEFVENEAICKELKKMGVDFAQGYGVGKPIPLEELTRLIKNDDSQRNVS